MREQEWCHQPRPLPLPTLITIALRSLLLQGGSRAQVTCLYHACVIKNGPLLPMCLDNKCTSTVLHNAPVQLSTLMQLAQLRLQLCELPAPVRLSPAPDPRHRHKLLQDCHLQPSPFPKKLRHMTGSLLHKDPAKAAQFPPDPTRHAHRRLRCPARPQQRGIIKAVLTAGNLVQSGHQATSPKYHANSIS